jgi:hypothetical protein
VCCVGEGGQYLWHTEIRVYHWFRIKKVFLVQKYSQMFGNIQNGAETFYCPSCMLAADSYYPLTICCSFPNQVQQSKCTRSVTDSTNLSHIICYFF